MQIGTRLLETFRTRLTCIKCIEYLWLPDATGTSFEAVNDAILKPVVRFMYYWYCSFKLIACIS